MDFKREFPFEESLRICEVLGSHYLELNSDKALMETDKAIAREFELDGGQDGREEEKEGREEWKGKKVGEGKRKRGKKAKNGKIQLERREEGRERERSKGDTKRWREGEERTRLLLSVCGWGGGGGGSL